MAAGAQTQASERGADLEAAVRDERAQWQDALERERFDGAGAGGHQSTVIHAEALRMRREAAAEAQLHRGRLNEILRELAVAERRRDAMRSRLGAFEAAKARIKEADEAAKRMGQARADEQAQQARTNKRQRARGKKKRAVARSKLQASVEAAAKEVRTLLAEEREASAQQAEVQQREREMACEESRRATRRMRRAARKVDATRRAAAEEVRVQLDADRELVAAFREAERARGEAALAAERRARAAFARSERRRLAAKRHAATAKSGWEEEYEARVSAEAKQALEDLEQQVDLIRSEFGALASRERNERRAEALAKAAHDRYMTDVAATLAKRDELREEVPALVSAADRARTKLAQTKRQTAADERRLEAQRGREQRESAQRLATARADTAQRLARFKAKAIALMASASDESDDEELPSDSPSWITPTAPSRHATPANSGVSKERTPQSGSMRHAQNRTPTSQYVSKARPEWGNPGPTDVLPLSGALDPYSKPGSSRTSPPPQRPLSSPGMVPDRPAWGNPSPRDVLPLSGGRDPLSEIGGFCGGGSGKKKAPPKAEPELPFQGPAQANLSAHAPAASTDQSRSSPPAQWVGEAQAVLATPAAPAVSVADVPLSMPELASGAPADETATPAPAADETATPAPASSQTADSGGGCRCAIM